MTEELTLKLLRLLEKNSRLSLSALAAMCQTTEEDVRSTLDYLENEGIVIGYHTVVNWNKIGQESVMAMIEVKITPQRDFGFNRIAERIANFPEVQSLYLMSGSYDLSVVLRGSNMQAISDFVSYKLSTIDGVQATVTHFIMKRYKDDDLIYEQHESDTRLAVTP